MKTPFDYFDKIYCICGEHETDRWKNCCDQFEKIGIMDKVERFSDFATEEQKNFYKMDGCTYSHYTIIKSAKEQKLKNIFIFESDFHFINYDFDLLNKSIKTLNNLDWKLFYLGGTSDVVWGVESENLVRSCVSTTVAYGVNGKYFEEIENKIENANSIVDQVYRRTKKFKIGYWSFYSYPMFVVQKDGALETKRRNYAQNMYERRVETAMREYLKTQSSDNERKK